MKKSVSNIYYVLLGIVYKIAEILWHYVQVKFASRKTNTLPPIKNHLLLEPVTILAAKIRSKKITSVELVNASIERIKSVNSLLNAVVDNRFDDALKDAKTADEYIQTSGKSEEELLQQKPFLGVPFSSKNAIGIQNLIMDAGIVAKAGSRAKEDSVAVAQLRKAGAIPLCVSNVPECCMWMDASNKLYGRTNNPYDLCRIPGGSSGGEGALIGSAASVFGIGNDIGGSIRIPSYSCGIFGHKPTRKIVSNQGQFPSSYRTDLDNFNVTGPMCRNAADLLPIYRVLAGENASKLKLDVTVDLRNIKIFYTDEYPKGAFLSPIQKQMKEPITKVVKYFEEVHGIKAQCIRMPVSPNHFTNIWLSKIGSARAPAMECQITNSDIPLSLPKELLKWFFRLCNHTFHILLYLFLQTYSSVNEPEMVKQNSQLLIQLDEGLKKILGNDGILLYPPQPELPYYHYEQIFKFYNVGYTGIFSVLGYPVTMCPTGLSKSGLPLGVQVVGTHYNDHLTLAVAVEIEKGLGGWRSPSPIQ